MNLNRIRTSLFSLSRAGRSCNRGLAMSGDSTPHPNIALLIGLVSLVIAGQLLWLEWPQLAKALGDTDDAMRLVEVRAFLAGRGWFDLHEPRLQPPMGYDTHWSRLIDAGLAGLLLTLRQFTDSGNAEWLMRVVWPPLWLAPAISGAVALAWRLGGRAASAVVLLLLLLGLPALLQFKPGRIDHHDVQITLALLTLAAAIWSDRVRWTAWVAGMLSALALAIGVEGIAFIVVAGAVFVVRYWLDRNAAAALSQYGFALAAGTALVFFGTIAPSRWMQTACDAMAINSAVPTILSGLVLGIAGANFAGDTRAVRSIGVLMTVGLAALAFVLLEPRCIRGPLAMMDPAVRSIWLAHIQEVQSWATVAGRNPSTAASYAAYPLAAIIGAMVLARDPSTRSDSGFITLVAALLVADAMALVAIRALPYALWFGMPFVAAALVRLFARLKLRTLPAMALVAIPFTPALLSWGAYQIMEAIGPFDEKAQIRANACLQNESYAALARLPAGLVVTDSDFGPFMLALTPHSVIAGPYHRLSYGLLVSHQAFAWPPGDAREVLRRARADYVVTCGTRAPPDLSEAELAQSLWTQLAAGAVPAWLERLQVAGPFVVYRFKPEASMETRACRPERYRPREG